MSFASHARRVRDRTLPHDVRYAALRRAAGAYMPLGYTATWEYLVESAGPPGEDEGALLRGLGLLERGRAAWLGEMESFGRRRRAQKRRGHGPRGDEGRYRTGPRWHGPDAREAVYRTVRTRWAPMVGAATMPPETGDAGLAAELVRAYLRSGGRVDATRWPDLRRCAARLRRDTAVPEVREPGARPDGTRDGTRPDGTRPDGMDGAGPDVRRLAYLAELVAHDAVPLVRRGWTGDAVEVRRVFLAATAGMPYLRAAEPDVGTPEWIDGFLGCGYAHELWVAERHGRVAGFVTYAIDQVGHLFVAPEQQGQGVGADLLRHAQRSRPQGLTLRTFLVNTRARRLYERLGFVVSGHEDEPGEPDVVYDWVPRR
ncbi:GNAT family N-acetyltransferase [Sphaerisporangium sp. B11E5]|uniref:GNAT family N-acetyltransferase n=1 Tax=Sphaerisporangium sp. B11E5 TaxID=3153563 RepID=UPI00325C5D31